MDTQTRKIVAANVRRLRKQADMNQTVLAQKADLGQTTISSLEQPEGKSPTLDILTAVAGAFGVPVWTLLIDMDDSPPDRMRALDVVVRAYTHIPADGQRQIERVAEAEQRYAKAS
jgi:transcriptional regulator with XRE-family HTH domain